MKSNVSNKEYFEHLAGKAFRGGNYDYFGIGKQGTRAAIYETPSLKIRNAFVIIKDSEKVQEWMVENYQVIQCPDMLHICIKNLNFLMGCIGDENNEDSYFKCMNTSQIQSLQIKVFAAVETEEDACVFYFDNTLQKSNYLYQSSNGLESTDLFMIVRFLKDLEGEIYEKQQMSGEELEREETSAEQIPGESFMWGKTVYE